MLMVDKRAVLPFPSAEALAAHKAKVAAAADLVTRTHDEFKEAIVDLLESGVRTAPKGSAKAAAAKEVSGGLADAGGGGGAAAAPAPAPASGDTASSGRFMGKLQSLLARVKDRVSGSSDSIVTGGGMRRLGRGTGRANVQTWQCVLCNEWTEPPAPRPKGKDGEEAADELPRCRICDTPRIEGKFRERLAALQVSAAHCRAPVLPAGLCMLRCALGG